MTKCTPCRVRHLTCDQNKTCSECAKSGRECVRGYNIRFRHLTCPSKTPSRQDFGKYDYFFDREQRWVDSSDGGKVEFVLDGDDGVSALGADVDGETVVVTDHTMRGDLPTPEHETVAPIQDREWAASNSVSKLDVLADQSLAESSFAGGFLFSGATPSDLETPASTIEGSWPLSNLREARLLQHFITHLAPWFDVGDQKRHFGRYVPCLAANSPLLMCAVLALSALHHNRVLGDGDSFEAMDYHDRCLSLLVSMLSDSGRVHDDCVLVTTVILHLYEDLEAGNDSIRHLNGTSIFYPAKGTGQSSQLRRAVFWIYLEMEIYNAYIHQRSVRTDFNLRDIESYREDEGDDMWYHRTLYIAAHVSKWAFGEDSSLQRWRELRQMVDNWESKRPSSFDPIYIRERDLERGKYFPEICYVTDEGVIASHFLYMAKLLLTTHNPNIPRIGPRVKSAMVDMQETALTYARAMVGSALCNHIVTARFTGSLVIMMCSGWFTDRREQQALLVFMRETDNCCGWPRKKARRTLMHEWSLEDTKDTTV